MIQILIFKKPAPQTTYTVYSYIVTYSVMSLQAAQYDNIYTQEVPMH